jgi:alpha-mannosidase
MIVNPAKKLFSATLISLIAISVSAAGAAATRLDSPTNRVLYTVGYAHLDTQWRWSYPQVIRQYIPNTMWRNFRCSKSIPITSLTSLARTDIGS